jgi:UDP-N-acetyl-D-mannosaminuronic acid dehydrogenase
MMLDPETWKVNKIVVVGPGIVGMPMAAMLAHAKIRIGTEQPAKVVVIQRNSATSGWKVDAINAGKSVIGGIEPDLDKIVGESVSQGLLSASHDYEDARDADVILFCVQTDKKGFGPDYGPMFEALNGVAEALKKKPKDKMPIVVFESTLAPSSMATLIKDHFAKYGLVEGKDILLGNSPNRVMPGRLVERVAGSDKIVAGLNPVTPKLIKKLYENIVTQGTLHSANSLTAEVIKTLENAYRDVRIAYAAEIVRYCDDHGIDFYTVRREVNTRLAQVDCACEDANAVPSGGLLVPTIGVGGHCLPKDGILLWWRRLETGLDSQTSLILESRKINDESPDETIRLAERLLGDLSGKTVALMGAAYRFNSEDTRNSPTLNLARRLILKGCKVTIHDPYVKPTDQNLRRFDLERHFTQNLEEAVAKAEVLFFCTAHKLYLDKRDVILSLANGVRGIVDGCNLYSRDEFRSKGFAYVGIGRGENEPTSEFIDFVYQGFRAVECGVANEVQALADFLNEHYANDVFNRVQFKDIQRIAGTCVTGCEIVNPGPIGALPGYDGFVPRLVRCAYEAWHKEQQEA